MYRTPPAPENIADLLALATTARQIPQSSYSPPLSIGAVSRRRMYSNSFDNDDDMDSYETIAMQLTRQTTWQRPLPSPSGSPHRDRERDRATPPPPRASNPMGARAVEMPPQLVCFSDSYEERQRLLGPGLGQEFCFACDFGCGDKAPPASARGMQNINELLRSQPAGKNKIKLAYEILEIFNRDIRDVINRTRHDDEPECPEWHPADIYDHYCTPKHSRVDSQSSAENRAIVLEDAFHNLYNFSLHTYAETENGQRIKVAKPDVLKLLMQLDGSLNRLYAKRPKEMAATASANITRAPAVASRRVFGTVPSEHLRP